jgi:hypothetical protein
MTSANATRIVKAAQDLEDALWHAERLGASSVADLKTSSEVGAAIVRAQKALDMIRLKRAGGMLHGVGPMTMHT